MVKQHGDEEVLEQEGSSSTFVDADARKKRVMTWTLLSVALVVVFSVVLVVWVLLSGPQDDEELWPMDEVIDDSLCVECSSGGELDDCGMVGFAFAPLAKGMKGVHNSMIQYKGSGEKLFEAATSLETVLRGIVGDTTARAESAWFRWIKWYLSSQNASLYEDSVKYRRYRTIITWMKAEGWKYLESKGYNRKEVQAGKATVSIADATCGAEYALNQYWSNFTRRELAQHYLNYSSSVFDNAGASQVWSSFYQEVSAMYGSNVAILKPDDNRLIDLDVWNRKANRSYSRPAYRKADAGEFVTPGWRYSHEFLGSILHPPHEPTNFTAPLLYYPIVFAFYKVTYDNVTYIAVLDGHMTSGELTYCIEQGSDGFLYYCAFEPWNYDIQWPPMPTLLSERCRTIGFISTCSHTGKSQDRCQEPPMGLIAQYQSTTSKYAIPPVLVDYIKETSWTTPSGRSTRLQFYPLNETAIVGPQSDIVLYRE